MHGQFESPARSDCRTSRQTAFDLILPVLAAIVLIALIIIQPNAITWVAEAAQAEFVADASSVPSPPQFAQPAAEPHSVTSDWITRVQTAWRGQR